MSDGCVCSLSPLDDGICGHAEECQRTVDDAITESVSEAVLLDCLQEAGATPHEAQDYITQFTAHRVIHEPGSSNISGQLLMGPDGDGLNPINTATTIAWALLQAKVNHLWPNASQTAIASPGGSLSDELANLGLPSSKEAISASVLAKAPHLVRLSDPTATDPPSWEDTRSSFSLQSSAFSGYSHQQGSICSGWWPSPLDCSAEDSSWLVCWFQETLFFNG